MEDHDRISKEAIQHNRDGKGDSLEAGRSFQLANGAARCLVIIPLWIGMYLKNVFRHLCLFVFESPKDLWAVNEKIMQVFILYRGAGFFASSGGGKARDSFGLTGKSDNGGSARFA